MTSSVVPYYNSYDYIVDSFGMGKKINKSDFIFDHFYLDTNVPCCSLSPFGVRPFFVSGFLNSMPVLYNFPFYGAPLLKDSAFGVLLCTDAGYTQSRFISYYVSNSSKDFISSNIGKYLVTSFFASDVFGSGYLGNSFQASNVENRVTVFDTFDSAFASIGSDGNFNRIIKLISSVVDFENIYTVYGDEFYVYGALAPVNCCFPDFSRIVKVIGGTPSLNELLNIKTIAYLLGCDTSDNGLSGCEFGLFYVKRIVSMLGGSVGSDLVSNLKEVCRILGVDNSENGLSGCELAKDYVNRISTILGG